MKKPAGVIVAAVILTFLAFTGTVSGIVLVVVFAMMPHPGLDPRAFAIVRAIAIACIGVPTALAWCVAIGLFRGKNWARIAGTVLGALVALSGGFFAISIALVMMTPHIHAPVTHFQFIIGTLMWLGAATFGLWLVIYLNLPDIRSTFRPGAQYAPATVAYTPALSSDPQGVLPPSFAAASPDQPAAGLKLSRIVVLVFAMLNILGSLSLLTMAAAGLPLIYPGLTLQGHAAALAMIVFAAINLVVAGGLYRRFRPAYYVAIATQLFTVFVSLAMLAPSYRERALASYTTMSPHLAPPPPPQMASMMHTLQNGILTFYAVLMPCICGFFIWALLRDLRDTRSDAALPRPS